MPVTRPCVRSGFRLAIQLWPGAAPQETYLVGAGLVPALPRRQGRLPGTHEGCPYERLVIRPRGPSGFPVASERGCSGRWRGGTGTLACALCMHCIIPIPSALGKSDPVVLS